MSLGSCSQTLSRSFAGSWLAMRGKLVVGGFGSFWTPGSDGFEDVFASRQGVSLTRGSDYDVLLELGYEAEECLLLIDDALKTLAEDVEKAKAFDIDGDVQAVTVG